MKEELISFETAKLAKEKGFNWECRFYYHPDKPNKAYGWFGILDTNSLRYLDEKRTPRPEISAPTQSLLQKWLRETHKIDTGLYYWDNDEYSYKLQKIVKGKMEFFTKRDIFVGTYEETLEVALMESLKLITIEKLKSITQKIIEDTKSW